MGTHKTGKTEKMQFLALVLGSIVVAGYSFCFFAKNSIKKLEELNLDYAFLKMDKQEESGGKWYNFMKNNYGAGKINVFMHGEVAFTTEIALKRVDNDDIIAKYVSSN